MKTSLAGLSLALLTGASFAQGLPPLGGEGMPPNLPASGPSLESLGIVPSHSDRAYGSGESQVLDVYLPGTEGPYPVVVYVHGGGFRFGDKEMANPAFVQAFLDAGYAVASISYRLSGEAPFPGAVQDVFAAVEHIKSNAGDLQIDGSKVVMYGESAGANLASLAGTAYDDPSFRSSLVDPSADIRPSAVIAQYPPVDFGQIDAMLTEQGCDASQINHGSAESLESLYLGAAVSSSPELVAQANPATYASANDPAFFIQNGDADCNVGARQGKILADALQSAGVDVTYELLAGAAHGGSEFEASENLAEIVAFLRS